MTHLEHTLERLIESQGRIEAALKEMVRSERRELATLSEIMNGACNTSAGLLDLVQQLAVVVRELGIIIRELRPRPVVQKATSGVVVALILPP